MGEYTPAIPPQKAEDLLPFLNEELVRIAQVANNQNAGFLEIQYKMPSRVKPGLFRYFDGTNGDPLGTGMEGLYYYDIAGNWKYVGTGGGGGGGAVDSVNGQTGVVVLDAADVGADPAGTAAAAVAAHVALPDPHPQYATEQDVIDAQYSSTCLVTGGQLTINAGNPARLDISAGTATFADYTNPLNSVTTVVNFGPFTAVVLPNLPTSVVTYIAIDQAGAVVQQTSRFTNTQRRSLVSLGAAVHSNNVSINVTNTLALTQRQGINQFGDAMRALGQLNLSGNVYGAVGASLQIQRTAGELFSPGSGFHTSPDNPHAAILAAANPVTFRYRQVNGLEGADTTSIDPNTYEASGVVTPVPNNKFTVQLIAVFQQGATRVQRGQEIYANLAEAVAAAQAQGMLIEQNIQENGVIRGYLAVQEGCTDLTNATQAAFVTLSKFSASAAASPISLSTTDELAEGAVNLYFTEPRVLGTDLAGLSLASSSAITASDTVLTSAGKLQAQVTNRVSGPGSSVTTYVPQWSGTTGRVLSGGLPVQTSFSDTTVGALMVNGAYNLGNQGPVAVNTLGMAFAVVGSLGSAGALTPDAPTAANWDYVVIPGHSGVNYCSQLAVNPATGATATRGKLASWSPWAYQWDSNNLVKQTSASDATAGRVQLNGAFGNGGNNLSSTDFNAITVGGLYAGASTAVGNPLPSSAVMVSHQEVAGGFAAQFVVAYGGGVATDQNRIFVRHKDGGVWEAPTELWHSRGTNAITVDTGSVGYGVGSGASVTQATNKATSVTLAKPTGQIIMNAASLAANTAVSFTVSNSKIGVNDTPVIAIKGGATAGAYTATVDAVAAGSCRISLRNHTAGALAEGVYLSFALIKGAIA